MKRLLNTLYITTPKSILRKDGLSIVVEREGSKVAQVPVNAIDSIVCMGFDVILTAPLMEFCAEQAVSISYLSGSGRFLARVEGPARGNVLLRKGQYSAMDDQVKALEIARRMVLAKIANQRTAILRHQRSHAGKDELDALSSLSAMLAEDMSQVRTVASLELLRGLEGDAARRYFSGFTNQVLHEREFFQFNERTRRPPRDPINSILSFVYTLLMHECRAALEVVGLDPHAGFLHALRPGRPSLALDLMEEFRAPLADRAVLTLINLKQVDKEGFIIHPTGEVEMKPETRRAVITGWQNRKRESIRHPVLEETMELGLAILVQARLLARHIRGELDTYPAFLWR